MTIIVSTNRGVGSSATTDVRTLLERDEGKTEQMLRTELAFIEGKLARSGLEPNQLMVRRGELIEAIANLQED